MLLFIGKHEIGGGGGRWIHNCIRFFSKLKTQRKEIYARIPQKKCMFNTTKTIKTKELNKIAAHWRFFIWKFINTYTYVYTAYHTSPNVLLFPVALSDFVDFSVRNSLNSPEKYTNKTTRINEYKTWILFVAFLSSSNCCFFSTRFFVCVVNVHMDV